MISSRSTFLEIYRDSLYNFLDSELKVTIWVGLNLATIAGYQFIVRTRNGSNW